MQSKSSRKLTDVEAWGCHGEAGVGDGVHLGRVYALEGGERHHRLPDECVGEAQVVVLQGEEEEACAHPVILLAQFTAGEIRLVQSSEGRLVETGVK